MYFDNFRHAQLMCFTLSYVLKCSAHLSRSIYGDGWLVSSDSRSKRFDRCDDPCLEVMRVFQSMTHENTAQPSWWNPSVLDELRTLHIKLEEMAEAERLARHLKEEKEEAARIAMWNCPVFQEDRRNAIAAGYRWDETEERWEYDWENDEP